MRRQFVIIAVILTVLLFSFHYLSFLPILSTLSREQFWQIFTVFCVGLSVWALSGQFHGMTFLPLLVLPTLYPLAATFFTSLLPQHWVVPLVFIPLFGISFYFLLLVENIYAVSSIRAIPLIRAARPIGLLFTVVTSFLLATILFSFRQNPGTNAFFGALFTFPLSMQALWVVRLDETLEEHVILYSLLIAFFMAEVIGWASFFPATLPFQALYVAIFFYVLLGIFQLETAQRLRQGILVEYIVIGGLSTIGFFLLPMIQA